MRQIAYETVLRACGFGSLAIFCIMVGLSFDPLVAFQSGGVLTMVMTGILVLKAFEARTKPYRRTEMWLYLPKEQRPPEATAQQLTATLMREIYLTFALWTARHLDRHVGAVRRWSRSGRRDVIHDPVKGGVRLSPAAACHPARRGRAHRGPRPPAP